MEVLKTSFNTSNLTENPLIKSVGFTEAELNYLSENTFIEKFNKGEKILGLNEYETVLRFIKMGLARQYYVFNNKEINTLFCSTGDIVCSYESYMAEEPSAFCIEALEPVILYSFKRDTVDAMMLRGADFIKFGKKISAYFCKQKTQREMELLNYDALGRLQNFLDNKPELFFNLPQKYIATYLNIAPETVSFLKRNLKYSARPRV